MNTALISLSERLDDIEDELLASRRLTDDIDAALVDIASQAFLDGDHATGYAALWLRVGDWGDPYVPTKLWTRDSARQIISGLGYHTRAEDLLVPSIVTDMTEVMRVVKKAVRRQFDSDVRALGRVVGVTALPKAWSVRAASGQTVDTFDLTVAATHLLRIAQWCPQLAASLAGVPDRRVLSEVSSLDTTIPDRTADAASMLHAFHDIIGGWHWASWWVLVKRCLDNGVSAEHFRAWLTQWSDALNNLSDVAGQPIWNLWLDLMPTAEQAELAYIEDQMITLAARRRELMR